MLTLGRGEERFFQYVISTKCGAVVTLVKQYSRGKKKIEWEQH